MRVPHDFRDPALYTLAMTHSSYDGKLNNERLEFLGDTVLDLIAAEALYQALPGHNEGDLSMAKAWLVSRKTLAAAARRLDLTNDGRFGRGLKTDQLPISVQANFYEAVIGAIYLDAGLEAATKFFHASLSDELKQSLTEGTERNHKQRLQEWAQRDGGPPPVYNLLTERGDGNRHVFEVQAEVDQKTYPSAWGKTRKEAESWAAHEALLVIAP